MESGHWNVAAARRMGFHAWVRVVRVSGGGQHGFRHCAIAFTVCEDEMQVRLQESYVHRCMRLDKGRLGEGNVSRDGQRYVFLVVLNLIMM